VVEGCTDRQRGATPPPLAPGSARHHRAGAARRPRCCEIHRTRSTGNGSPSSAQSCPGGTAATTPG